MSRPYGTLESPQFYSVLTVAAVVLAFAYNLWSQHTGGATALLAHHVLNQPVAPTRSASHPSNLSPSSPLNMPIDNGHYVSFTLHPNGDGLGAGVRINSTEYADVDDVIGKHCCALMNITDQPERCAPHSGARLINEAGVRLLSFNDAEEGNRVYCVVQGVHFVWPLVKVGHKIYPKNIVSPIPGHPVVLTQLSNAPRVFAVDNFVPPEEVEELLRNNKDRLSRSEVGFGGWQDDTRTSYTSWDSESKASLAIQIRTFEILAMDPDPAEMADAVQVLRYTSDGFKGQGEWYKPHVDWFDAEGYDGSDPKVDNGTNRMATMFLYLSDVAEGGCTVFPLSTTHDGYNGEQIVHEGTMDTPGYINTQEARAACNTNSTALKACPKQGNAVLFYSQGPDGTLDPYSLHGGCPPLNGGVKYSANVWIWNRHRPDKSMAKDKPPEKKNKNPNAFPLTLRNGRRDPLRVFWDAASGAPDAAVDEDATAAFQADVAGGGSRFRLQYDLPKYKSRQVTTFDGHVFVFVDQNDNVVLRHTARKPTGADVDPVEGEEIVAK